MDDHGALDVVIHGLDVVIHGLSQGRHLLVAHAPDGQAVTGAPRTASATSARSWAGEAPMPASQSARL
jgi:hypothetical protein